MKITDISVKQWLRLANGDYASANHLLTLHPLRLEVICYLCEQAVEKYLKAYLISSDIEPPRTHDLVALNRLCCKKDESFNKLFECCARLAPYGVQVRYPSNIEIFEEDMRMALRDAQTAQEHILFVLQENN